MASAVIAAALFQSASESVAQQRSGCYVEQVGGTNRQHIRCRGGISIVAERGASYRLLDRNRDGGVDAMELTSKAVLVRVEVQARRSFEIVTPQAVAAVRGTRWAVDVVPGKTSVLVTEGVVGVRRASGGSEVSLTVGEGVDVEAGRGTLTVRRWGRTRTAALLRRLGQ